MAAIRRSLLHILASTSTPAALPTAFSFFAALLLLLFLLLLLLHHRHSLSKLRQFPYAELKSSTGGFSDAQKIGQGGSGIVYRGLLTRTREEVAVKRLMGGIASAEAELQNEIRIMTHLLDHDTLSPPPPTVGLLGFCRHGQERLLVYEYMPHHSLQEALFHENGAAWPLSWEQRFKVAIDTARALAFLHSRNPAIIYGDIKPSNILLDANLSARIADFGLATFKLVAAATAAAPTTDLSHRHHSCTVHAPKSNAVQKEKKTQNLHIWPKRISIDIDAGQKKLYNWTAMATVVAAPPSPVICGSNSPCSSSSFFTESSEYSDAASSSVVSRPLTYVEGDRSDSEEAAERLEIRVDGHGTGRTAPDEQIGVTGEDRRSLGDASSWWRWRHREGARGGCGYGGGGRDLQKGTMTARAQEEVESERKKPGSSSQQQEAVVAMAATSSIVVDEGSGGKGVKGGSTIVSKKRGASGRRGRSCSSTSLEWWMQHSEEEEEEQEVEDGGRSRCRNPTWRKSDGGAW